jgi:hypothetical protein
MASTPTRNPRLRSHLLRTLALSLGAIAIVGLTDIAPANAWYDAYGYWHPNHGYYYHHAYWRHHRWCEYHPGACYRHYGYYGYDRY